MADAAFDTLTSQRLVLRRFRPSGEWSNDLLYAVLRREWLARR